MVFLLKRLDLHWVKDIDLICTSGAVLLSVNTCVPDTLKLQGPPALQKVPTQPSPGSLSLYITGIINFLIFSTTVWVHLNKKIFKRQQNENCFPTNPY
jgi:hypothetical protein